MVFKHACFVSYCNDEGMTGFMKQLEEALNSSIGIHIGDKKKAFIDKKLQPGDVFDKKLAKAICQSICLIAIYTPPYEESEFCLKEFAAMEAIEDRRMQLIGEKITRDERLIIPIIFRGEDDLPAKISENIHYCDCSKILLSAFLGDLPSNPVFLDKIEEEVVKVIRNRNKKFKGVDVCSFCESFEFSDKKILPWRNYLFNWRKIEIDNEKLREYLGEKFDIDWTKPAEINKLDGNSIEIFADGKKFLMVLNNDRTRVQIKTDAGTTDEFIAKFEIGELNIYKNFYDPFPRM